MDTMPDKQPMENRTPLAGLDPAELLKQGFSDDTLADGAPSAFNPPSIEELAGLFPKFEILELIGKGGMGAVYKVRQKELDRIVALKILPPGIGKSPEFSSRFTREARALAKLNHPGIVTIHEFGQKDELYYILMEFVDGVNLAQLMKTGRVSPREALAIVPQICDALQYAHDQGIVHRDIKPENILLDRLGRVKVADFGIAKVVAAVCEETIRRGDTPVPADKTLAGKIIGTPQYMAPEQIDHPADVDHRADIYALGVVFYQMLTGELPGKEMQAPSRKVQIDVRLDEIVLKALEKNPEQRFQQASVMRTRVETIGNNSEKVPEYESKIATVPLRDRGVRWIIHLVWAACASGLVTLTITFVAEVLTKERGDLNQSLMTWEDVYGPVIMLLLGGGLLAIPIKTFRFASPRVWIGAFFATAAITAIAYVLAAPLEDHAFHSTNFIVAVAICGLGTFLCGFAAVFGKEKLPHSAGHPLPPRSRKLIWLVAACFLIGALWVALRNSGESYPASSLSPRYNAPVMGRIEFKFTHPESLGGKGVSYDIKKWGDTQWMPSSGNQITLKSGRTLLVKSRVNAIRPDVPLAMVTTSSGDSGWETQELKIDGIAPVRNLVFANGLRVEIHWTPLDLSKDRTKAPDPTQQQVMLWASNESDRMHPVSVDTANSVGTSGTPIENKLADYLWEDMDANDLPTDGVRQTLDGRTVLKIENPKNAPIKARLLTIENPPIKAMRYAISGEIRYEDVQGQGYMEMWSAFPEGRYFSRTLEASGPMSQLTGTSDWREFTLLFDRTGTKNAPTRIEVNLYLPGRGVVFVGPLRLVEFGPEKTADDVAESRMHPGRVDVTTKYIMVSGEVRRAGQIRVEAPASLLDALAAVGGWTGNADLRKIQITIPGATEAQTHDLNAIVNGEVVNPVIAPGSVIEISEK